MTDPVSEFIEHYKAMRVQHLGSQFDISQQEGRQLTSVELIAQDEKFFSSYLLDIAGISKLRNAQIASERWLSVILALKNRAEILGARIDFYNYFHTFLAVALALSLIAAQHICIWNLGLAVITLYFIVKVFEWRANLRVELSTMKELANVFEQVSKGAI